MKPDDIAIADEKQLMSALQQGDKAAFNTLYERYWERAYNDAYKRVREPELVKDILQEIFAAIWLNREKPIDNMEAYIRTAVRNRVFKLAKKLKATCPLTTGMDDQLATHLAADQLVRADEFNVAFERLLADLPPQRQKIFRLRFQEDLSTKSIAERMGITQKTVQNQLGKAMENIRGGLVQLPILVYMIKVIWP
jgi:RNA polymerase sigma factor, sigma-70 family